MNTHTKSIQMPTEEGLTNTVLMMIQKKRDEFIRVTSASLVTLFWEIGKEFNRYNNTRDDDKALHKITTRQFAAVYGSFFTEKNLKKMQRFAEQFSDFTTVMYLGSMMSWEHIQLLLEIEEEAKPTYITLVVEQQMTARTLKKHLSSNALTLTNGTIAKKSSKRKTTDKAFLKLLHTALTQQSYVTSVLQNPFTEPVSSSLRPLLDASKQTAPKKETKSIDSPPFSTLSQLIEKFIDSQNRRLNADLTFFFWEIGKQINKNILMGVDRASVIRDISLTTKTAYGKDFNEKQLHAMTAFAEHCTDIDIAYRIAYLTRWEHILLVASIPGIEAMLFYARITAAEGLNTTKLRKHIAGHSYEKTIGAREREQEVIATIRNPIVETHTKRVGNNTTTIKSKFINFGDDMNSGKAVASIFTNPYFLSLVQS